MILVTGHLGFIGSRLTPHLKEDWVGYDLRDGMNLLTCELPDYIDTIYHLAAQSSVEASWHDPLNDLDNIRITARLAHEYPNTKIVYANSCAALSYDSPYGFSKRGGADYLLKFHEKTINLIFPNIYGEGSRSVVDIFKDKSQVEIFGDGTHTRDYVHVDDIVEGLLKAAKWDPGTYFMGTGKSVSVNELAGFRRKKYLPSRKEADHVHVPNTTPNWHHKADVFDYLAS